MDPRKPLTPTPLPSPQELAVLEALRSTPFGSVEVVLHQSRIVQVVRTERVKIDPDPSATR
jgi:hypothetical protein